MQQLFDVIIVGGSYAGQSAALALGRSLRNVLLIDSNLPCNRQTPHSQNFLTHDGKTPKQIHDLAKADLAKYNTIQFLDDIVVSGKKISDGFEVKTARGDGYTSKKIIFATGIRDIMPEIEGFAECWGISLIHCPYCHGYEYRSRKTLALANGDAAVHYARLVGNLTSDLTIITNGPTNFTQDQLGELEQRNVGIVDKKISKIIHSNGYVSEVVFADGSIIRTDAIYAKLPFQQHCTVPDSLGCELDENGFIKTDAFQQTTVSGVWACGDCTSPMRSVANAVGTGNLTGAAVNMQLCAELPFVKIG